MKPQTLHYVHWFNHHRLLEVNGDLPPNELKQAYYRQHTGLAETNDSKHRVSGHARGIHLVVLFHSGPLS